MGRGSRSWKSGYWPTRRHETLRELNSTKGQLLALRRAITPQREAVNKLIRDENELVSQTVRTYLRDTYDHVVQTTEAVESARELVNGLLNTYLSVISNRMNEVMKTLTIVASIFVPLTFVAGIYGMNFENMPELQKQWAYPAAVDPDDAHGRRNGALLLAQGMDRPTTLDRRVEVGEWNGS